MAHEVFISYPNEDKPIADAICAFLESKKIRCWVAPRDVIPGLNYAEQLIQAIDSSRILVLVFSSRSNGSPHVLREVERAVSKGLIIIPFRIEEVTPSDSMQYFIQSTHWLDALTPPLEQHLERLSQTVHLILTGTREIPQEQYQATDRKLNAQTQSMKRGGENRADFLLRFLAYVIDNAIIWLLGYAITHVVFSIYESATNAPMILGQSLIIVWSTWGTLYLMYFVLFEISGMMATPGKYLVGLKIVDFSGNRISVKSALIRTLSKLFTFSLLGLTMLRGTEKMTIYDTTAEVQVLKRER